MEEIEQSKLKADQRRREIKEQIEKRREAIRMTHKYSMPNLKVKRVIGVYKAPKKLSDLEIRK